METSNIVGHMVPRVDRKPSHNHWVSPLGMNHGGMIGAIKVMRADQIRLYKEELNENW